MDICNMCKQITKEPCYDGLDCHERLSKIIEQQRFEITSLKTELKTEIERYETGVKNSSHNQRIRKVLDQAKEAITAALGDIAYEDDLTKEKLKDALYAIKSLRMEGKKDD